MIEEMARTSLIVAIVPVAVAETLGERRNSAMICQLGSRVDLPGGVPRNRFGTHLISPQKKLVHPSSREILDPRAVQ